MAARSKGFALPLVQIALVIGLAAPLLVLAGALATKFGIVDWKTGFGTMTVGWAPRLAMAGCATGLAALVLALTDVRRLGVMALIAFLAPAATLGLFWKFRSDARSVPPIHDVSTNWTDPPGFSREIMAARAGSPNPVEADPHVPESVGPPWGGRRVADINRETCPGARTAPGGLSADRVAEVLEANGVQVKGRAPWRVEGVVESFWYGFKDDVVVRIRPEGTDVRSVSRVGRSDIGANCRRVTRIVEGLSEAR